MNTPLRIALVVGAIIVAAVLGLVVGLSGSVPTADYGFAVGFLGFVLLAPLVIARFVRRRRALALLPAVSGFFVLEFAIGGLFYRNPRSDSVLLDLAFIYDARAMSIALLLAFGGWLLLLAGYALATPIAAWFRRIPQPTVSPSAFVPTVIVLLLIGWIARAAMFSQGWYFHIGDVPTTQSAARNLVVTLANLPLVAAALLGVQYYRGEASIRWLYWAMIGMEVVWAVPSGERSRLIGLGVLLLVVRYYMSQKPLPRVGVAVGVLAAVLVIFPFGVAYREGDGTTYGYQEDPVGRMGAAVGTLASGYANEPIDSVTNGVDQTLRRFAGITSLAVMVEQGPGKYPAEPGFALRSYASAVVPRAVFPGKADPSRVANDFGVRYRIIRPGNPSAVAMTTLGDFWGTFGLLGLGLGMVLVGGALRGLDEYFRDLRESPAMLAVYATALGAFLVSFETTFAVGFLQTVREGLVYLIVLGSISVAFAVVRSRPRVARMA
ncbi:MAG: hypothetical protein JHC84_05790 [Solirubrobacteraceae bacterium]|nr:hypothetical protein [Solirubrobacteraceae bacterium]